MLDIIFISFWLIFGPKNDSKSDLTFIKKQIVPPGGPKGAQGGPQGSISGLLEVPWPPLCATGTTFGALLPLMELVLGILGNFWYMLGSSSPHKRQILQKTGKTAEGI